MAMEERVWVEKYRPKKISEIILPAYIRKEFEEYISKGDIPNLLLYSKGGRGKGSISNILQNELDSDFLNINGSLDTSIDVVRDKVVKFSSTRSLTSNNSVKIIFVTEFDGFSTAAQNSMKNVIEQFSKNVRFIFDTNHIEKIAQPIKSRCVEIDFEYDKKDYKELMKQSLERSIYILEQEKIVYDKKDIADLIKREFPDIRKIINNLQKYSVTGEFIPQTGSTAEEFDNLMNAIKSKNFNKLREVVRNIKDYDNMILKMFNSVEDIIERESLPQFIMILGDTNYKTNTVLSKELNFLYSITEMLSKGIKFK